MMLTRHVLFKHFLDVTTMFVFLSISITTKWINVGGGGYPKNSDDSPNTRERVLNTFKYKVKALRDCDCLNRLHKFPKV
jgi:diaminopimelate decarboxylase